MQSAQDKKSVDNKRSAQHFVNTFIQKGLEGGNLSLKGFPECSSFPKILNFSFYKVIFMKNTVRLVAAALVGVLLLSATSCADDKKVLDSSKVEQTTVMSVAGHDVPLEIYRYIALNYKNIYENGKAADIWLGDSGTALMNELAEDVRESVINLYATVVMCETYGIDADDSYITDSLEVVMDAVYEEYEYDYKTYAEAIAQHHMNDGVYRFVMRNELLAEELLHEMVERGEIPSDEAEFRAVFESDDFIRVKQILISNENGRSDEECLALANDILDRVNAGEDFDTLVQQCGEDLFMFNNDNGYYFARGHLDTSFEDAAFALAVGEVSGIVETSAGYSIIKRYEKDADYIDRSFDELCDEYVDGRYNLALEAFAETLTVTETDELKNYSIFSLADTEK